MNIPLKYEDVVAKLDAALAREAALREELAALRESYEAMRDRKNSIVDLQQRLTGAEQRVCELAGLLRDAASAHGKMLLSDPPQEAWKYHRISERIAAALKSFAEGEGS